MPKELMTWRRKDQRWYKKFKLNGKWEWFYYNPKKHGVPPTKEGSRAAANHWWESKRRELDALTTKVALPPPRSAVALSAAPIAEDDLGHTQEQHYEAWLAANEIAEGLQDRTVDLATAKRLVAALTPPEPTSDDLGTAVTDYLAHEQTRVEARQISPGRYAAYRYQLQKLTAWAGERSVASIDGATLSGFHTHLLTEIGTSTGAYQENTMNTAIRFIRWLWETNRIKELPRNIDSDKIKIKKRSKAIKVADIDLIKTLIAEADDKAKLYILLMLNCGYTQADIGKLKAAEVDWKTGTITRKRSKTQSHKDVPTVTYTLWRDTFRLLKKQRAKNSPFALLGDNGLPLWREAISGEKTSAINSSLFRLKKRLKVKFSAKWLRSTSSTVMGGHEVYGRFTQLFLGHSPRTIADKHYVVPSQELFDKAVSWLGEQYGVK